MENRVPKISLLMTFPVKMVKPGLVYPISLLNDPFFDENNQANLHATIQQFNTDLLALISGDSSRHILPANTDLVKKAGRLGGGRESEASGYSSITWEQFTNANEHFS